KNFARVAVLCAPAQYAEFLAALAAGEGAIDLPFRRRLAAAAFAHTRDYDTEVAAWFAGDAPADTATPGLGAPLARLRYGENPHQRGALHPWLAAAPPFMQLAGGELSYNNLLDLGAALDLLADLDLGGGEPAAAVIKHGNPCGIGYGETAAAALDAAWRSDPVSAYGSVVALSAPADAAVARFLAKKFVELLVAPSYSEEALGALAAKSKLRLLALPEPAAWRAPRRLRSIGPLLLVQDEDAEFVPPAEWRRVAGPAADAATLRELERAWRAVKHVKSNAIVIWREEHLIGAGAGQMSRLDSCRLAVAKARELGHALDGAVAASDAFFPFADGLELLAEAGIRAVVEPGGSVRDAEVIARAEALGVSLLFTGRRHFRH
ncbi:bifunctional phosphoribosylaminoimidazolecarboxamide formyltransferase/IMP cyclohydrolase, partial [bacterium]|nr:bifunctional phosphoribosylaminoimidazolecarboxamide formyltransferase/IMP cyclohydrolase [bacterium]